MFLKELSFLDKTLLVTRLGSCIATRKQNAEVSDKSVHIVQEQTDITVKIKSEIYADQLS
jgi:hypothetical protein